MKKYLILNQQSSGKFWRGVINNRPHLFTEVIALEAPSVMNRILYPAELVFNAVKDLISKPAPAKHPKVNGEHVSALHPLAVNAHNIGGFISNARREGNKVIAELALDIDVASKDERGVETMRRIEAGERIGFSTGLPWAANEEKGELDGEAYDFVMNSIRWDHLAILLDEEPAGKNTYNIVNCNVKSGDDKLAILSQGTKIMDWDKFFTALVCNANNSFFNSDIERLKNMSELELVDAITNAQIKSELTLDQAKAKLEAEGLAVNAKAEVELFASHKAEFEAFLADKKAKRDELITELVANSKLTQDALNAMSDEVLQGIKQSLSVGKADFSQRGSQIVNERTTPDSDESFADYH